MAKSTFSTISVSSVANLNRLFGADMAYVPVIVKTFSGLVPALFTQEQVTVAMERAKNNPEDAPIPTWKNKALARVLP